MHSTTSNLASFISEMYPSCTMRISVPQASFWTTSFIKQGTPYILKQWSLNCSLEVRCDHLLAFIQPLDINNGAPFLPLTPMIGHYSFPWYQRLPLFLLLIQGAIPQTDTNIGAPFFPLTPMIGQYSFPWYQQLALILMMKHYPLPLMPKLFIFTLATFRPLENLKHSKLSLCLESLETPVLKNIWRIKPYSNHMQYN